MSRSWEAGSTYAWRRLRRAVLLANANENQGRCQLDVGRSCPRHTGSCPNVCTGKAVQVHHAKGKRYGDDARYLVACCAECNLHLGDPGRFDPQPTPRSRW